MRGVHRDDGGGIAQKYAVVFLICIITAMATGTFICPVNTLYTAEFRDKQFACALHSMVVFATSANQAVIQVVKGLDRSFRSKRYCHCYDQYSNA